MKFWVKIIKKNDKKLYFEILFLLFSPKSSKIIFCIATYLFWQGDAGKGWEVDEKEGGGEDGWEDDGDWGELEVGHPHSFLKLMVGHWHSFGLAEGRSLPFLVYLKVIDILLF